jgi:hypothetical protein
MDSGAKARLDVAIAAINTQFHTNFSRTDNASGSFALDATDVFIGAIGTSLVSEACKLENPMPLQPNVAVDLCERKYSLVVEPSAVPGRYSLVVTPMDGSTAKFDEEYGVQNVRQLDDHYVMRAMVRKDGAGLTLSRLNVLFVGAAGK